MTLLELGCKLLQELGIRTVFVLKDHLEIRYEGEGKQVIAFGKTEKEAIENFYELHEQAFNLEKKI